MTKYSNRLVWASIIALLPLSTFACGGFTGSDDTYFHLAVYLIVAVFVISCLISSIKKYKALGDSTQSPPEIATHSKNISKYFLIFSLLSILFWFLYIFLTASLCLESTSPAEQYRNSIISDAYMVTSILALAIYAISNIFLIKHWVNRKMVFLLLLLVLLIEIIPLFVLLKLTLFFPGKIPERFEGVNYHIKLQSRPGEVGHF